MSGKAGQKEPERLAREMTALCAKCGYHDIGNGQRMRIRFGDLVPEGALQIIMRVAHFGFFVFDGTCWRHDEDERRVRPLAHDVVERIADEAALVELTDAQLEIVKAGQTAEDMLDEMGDYNSLSEEEKPTYSKLKEAAKAGLKLQAMIAKFKEIIHKHAVKSSNTARINAVITEAGPYVAVSVDDLDQNRYALNCKSGTLHFRRIEDMEGLEGDLERSWEIDLRPHDPADRITKIIDCALDLTKPFDPETDCPQFIRFLKDVQPMEEIRDFLQRWMGLCLTGIVSEQCFVFFYGNGRNGKSTFVELMSTILGDYAASMSMDSFSGERRRSGAEATPDLARLPGVRMVVASEAESGVALNEALVKLITGTEKFPARRLQKEFFEVDPHFKLMFSGNDRPRIKGSDDGIWRRVRLVPWEIQIAKNKVDVDLPEKLRAEAAGIFRWMVEGALDYLTNGLQEPAIITEATQELREDSDPVGSFILSCLEVTGASEDRIMFRELYAGFLLWASSNGEYQLKDATFSKRMKKLAANAWDGPSGDRQKFYHTKASVSAYDGIRWKSDFNEKRREVRNIGEGE